MERQRLNEAYIENYKNAKICRYSFVKQISYNYKKWNLILIFGIIMNAYFTIIINIIYTYYTYVL